MDDNKDNTLIEIGLRYQSARKACGLTQEQAAEIGDTNQQSISAAEHGEYYLASDVAYRLCVGYGITVEYLMTGAISDADTAHLDPRAKHLSPEQFFNYKAMIDNFFASHGIAGSEKEEDSR